MIQSDNMNSNALEQGIRAFAIAEFEKVSFDEYKIRMEKYLPTEYLIFDIKALYDSIKIPTRGTKFSAGYDFHLPLEITLLPGKTVTIPTGIKADVAPGWMLLCSPRSGLGNKQIMLADTMGIIDGDYYNCEKTEGDIIFKLHNYSDQTVILKPEVDSFIQGIFIPCGYTVSDKFDQKVRVGGFGSTNKNRG